MSWLLWLLLLAYMFLLTGAFYQIFGTARDRRLIHDRGRLVEIDSGELMFVSERGFGGPTVVFESGLTASSLHWAELETKVSMLARTFAYDRVGLGWSSACTKERTPANLVLELRALLEKSDIKPPYLFVAHSYGGLIARHFASEYADEVAGLILLDPMRVEDWHSTNEFRRDLLKQGVRMMERAIPLAKIGLIRLAAGTLQRPSGFFAHAMGSLIGKGGQRMVERTTCELFKLPFELRPGVIAQWSTPGFYQGAAAYFHGVPASVREMQDAKPVKDVPILVLSPESTCPLPEDSLRRIGLDAIQRVVQGSGHWVHLDRPDLVLDAIYDMLHEIREDAQLETLVDQVPVA